MYISELYLNTTRAESLELRRRVQPRNIFLYSSDRTSPLTGSPDRNKWHVTLAQYVIFTQIPMYLLPSRC